MFLNDEWLTLDDSRFRWADLQLVRLEGCHTEGAILHTLDTLPETLSDTYSTILNDLPEFDRKAARTILIWVTFSYLPLTLELLARLVNFFVPQSVIYVCTTSLITVSSYDLVRLAHFSVKEFLVSSNSSEQQDWYQFSVSSGNLTIVDMSLSLLLKQDKELTRNEAFDQPELVYAAKYLRFHLPKLDIEYQSPELHEKIDKLFRHSAVYYNWQRIEYDKKISSIWHYSPDDHEPLIYRASKMGLMKTVKRLLDDGASPFTPFYMKFGSDDNAFWVAARRGNLDVLDLLLQVKIDIRQDIAHEILNIIDTRDENMERVRTTLNLLHDRSSFYSGYDPKQGNAIDDDVFAEAASNQRSGDVLVQILLDWPNRAVIHFTPRIMRAVVTNTKLGDKIMQQVLDDVEAQALDSQYGSGEMTPSDHYNPMGAEIVVEKAGRGIKLDYSKLRDWVRQTTSEIIHLLLSYRENILITSDLLIAATANSDPGVFRILISQKPPSVHITTEVLAAVAQRNKSEDLELMEMLLENWDPDTPISEEVIYALASNTFRGEEIMRLLLQRQQAGIYVSQRTLAMAAQFHRREMVELLIKNAGPDTRITEEVLCGAACNSREPEAMMKYLFELGGSEVDISDELLISAAGNCQIDDLLSLTLDWFPQERVADRVFKAACDSTNAMTVLLKRFPRQFPTEIVVEAIAHGPFPSAYQDVLELLIAQEKIHIDQNLVERLSWNWRALGTFSRLQPDFPVSPLALATAAKDIKSMEALLYDRHLVFDITADIVDAALQTVGFAVIRLLFGRHRSDFPITHMVLTRAALHPDSQEVLEFLLKVEHKVVIQEVWEYVWGSDSAETDKIGASIVLGKHATLRLTESLMETMSSRSVHDEFDFDDLIAFCAENNISMAESERALSIVIERSYYPWTVELFLRYNPEIKVTQEQFNALTGDGDAAESLMQILLGRKNMC
jgi:hypothetical protein